MQTARGVEDNDIESKGILFFHFRGKTDYTYTSAYFRCTFVRPQIEGLVADLRAAVRVGRIMGLFQIGKGYREA